MTISNRSLTLANRLLAHELTVDFSDVPGLLQRQDNNTENLTALREIADQVPDGYLSRADLWAYLSRPEITAEQRRIVQSFFSYRGNARLQEEVQTEFRHIDLNNTSETAHGQVAYLSITPHNYDASLAPVIFVDGLHHSSRVYFEMARQLAVRTHRKIFVVDLPSMGGSLTPGNTSVDERSLNQAVSAVLHQEIPENGHVVLMGHSLGTVPLRDLFLNPRRLQSPVTIDRLVLIAAVPSLADRHLGYQVSPLFVLAYAGATVLQNAEVSALSPSLFFNGHSDAAWLTQVTHREYFHNHLLDTARIFLRTYSFPSLAELAQDSRVSVVFAENDHLMVLQNPETWQGRGVYFLPHAPHSSIAGRNPNPEEIDILAAAIERRSFSSEMPVSTSRIQSAPRRDIRLRIFGQHPASAGVGAQVGTQLTLFHTPAIGMTLTTGVNFDLLLSSDSMVRGETYMGLELQTERHLPIFINGRLIVGMASSPLAPYTAWETSVRVCLEGICPEAFIRRNISSPANSSETNVGAGLSLNF